MSGFTNIAIQETQLAATKPVFKQGGTSIRNRVKKPQQAEEANPFANLSEQPALIDEAALLADNKVLEESTNKFASEGDRIMAGKPCANCNCGKKELYESEEGKKRLETGQV